MEVKKVRYAEHVPGIVDRHYIMFLTQSGELLLTDSFLNVGDAKRVAENIMGGKSSSSSFAPFPGVFTFEREHYDKNLVQMAKTGDLIDCLVIENAPSTAEEIVDFATKIFKEGEPE